MSDEGHYAVPLWPTPWYLRVFGFKRWRYYKQKPIHFVLFPLQPVGYRLVWEYVDSVHEITSYTPVRKK